LQVLIKGDALTRCFWSDGTFDYSQSVVGNWLLEAVSAMGDEVGVGLEGDNLEPFFQIEVGVLAFVQADIENQIGVVRHLVAYRSRLSNSDPFERRLGRRCRSALSLRSVSSSDFVPNEAVSPR
jgi:hypothetical protein